MTVYIHWLVENGKIAAKLLTKNKNRFATRPEITKGRRIHRELEAAYEVASSKSLFRMSNGQQLEVPPFAKEVRFEKVDDCSITLSDATAASESYGPSGYLIEADGCVEALACRHSRRSSDYLYLSHLGVEMDHLIAETYPEIQVILGGTYHFFEEGGEQTLLTW